ncbi:hypothetical protein [Myroides odoratimimus]|uniref:hypothetical protein n=1 Tax=Myroides odoratimimus TaxID=76832 RepID=UPI0025754365|nr:hypothetical protein [Myroides odoratimimus]MDM1092091.1 hypothetical protein [Myroides odoratimimus]
MVDFIKVMLPSKYQSILECNEYLNFTEKVNTTTGEILSCYKVAYYKNMKFEIHNSGNIFISGSLHKLFNDGQHNYNDFHIDNLLSTIQFLTCQFNINAQDCRLRCLEVGVNVVVPYEVDKIINHSILHRKVPFEVKYNSVDGNYKQVMHSQYFIKLYNKTKHFKKRFSDVPDNLMRFEIKYRKMEKLNRIGIYSLNDLKRELFLNFKESLLLEWDNVLFYDFTTQIDHLKERERLKIERYDSLNFWDSLIQGTNENYKYHKGQLKKSIDKYSNNVQSEVSSLIGYKIDELIKETTLNDHLYIESNKVVSLTKKCIITNVNISMQRDASLLLSHSGLRYYFEKDINLYNRIKNEYLSYKWINSPMNVQIREIAHNIRNKASNTRVRNSKYYIPQQYNIVRELGV